LHQLRWPLYHGLLADDVTFTILFRFAETDPQGNPVSLGKSLKPGYLKSYAYYLNFLAANRSTAHDATALQNMPGSSASQIRLSSALGRALGFNAPGNLDDTGGNGGTYDGIITLDSAKPLRFTRDSGLLPSEYDALRVVGAAQNAPPEPCRGGDGGPSNLFIPRVCDGIRAPAFAADMLVR
jgi:hypothetical protein